MMGLANWALWQFQRYATAQPWWWHVITHLHNGVRQQRATWIRIQLWVSFCQGETWLVIPHNFRILNNAFQSHSSFQGGLPDTTNMCYTELCPWKSLYCCCIHKQKNPWDALCLMLCNDWTKYLSWLLPQYSWIPKTLRTPACFFPHRIIGMSGASKSNNSPTKLIQKKIQIQRKIQISWCKENVFYVFLVLATQKTSGWNSIEVITPVLPCWLQISTLSF